jgi:SAM-dependent methyltransferase
MPQKVELVRKRADRLIARYYPNGFRSGTIAFYQWVRKSVAPSTVMLNLGAGPPTEEPLRIFKGEVARVVGADIDPVVLQNLELDEAHIYRAGESLPFAGDSFDLVLSDFVLEHVGEPLEFLNEVRRVLRPGGAFFFRTPNRCHYVTLIARATPQWFHRLAANRARALSDDSHEPWPTWYRLNTRRKVAQVARAARFSRVELRTHEAEPSYLVFHPLPFLIGVAYERVVNRFDVLAGLRANIFGRLVK